MRRTWEPLPEKPVDRRRALAGGRWGIIPIVLLFALLSGCGEKGRLPGVNIILITVDTMRADRLGSYGHAAARTPTMDRLARDGVLFADMSTSVPLTLPSHATVLTGLFPSRHGVHDNGSYRLPDERTTLAEYLADAGYRTAAFVASFQLDRKYGLAQGFAEYEDRMPAEFRIYNPRIASGPAAEELRHDAGQRRADALTALARSWILKGGTEPFFLWLHYFDPHETYDPPPPFDRMGPGGAFPGPVYDGEIAFLDREIGKLVQIIEDRGLYDRTLIILTADHGEGLGQHREVYHDSFVYDSTIRVPLFLAGGAVPASWPRLVTSPVRNVDILPTVLDAAGIRPRDEVQGTSVLAILDGRKTDGVWNYIETYSPSHNLAAKLFGIRTERWKYIEAPAPELYDLDSDPGETMNIVDDEPAKARELRGLLVNELPKDEGRRVAIDEETRAKLEAIGYVQDDPGDAAARPEENDPKDLIPCIEGLHVAMRYYTYGAFDSSLAVLEKLRAECPGKTRIYDRIAMIRVRLDQYEELIRDFEEIVRAYPGYEKGLFWLGLGYLQTGRPEEALPWFRRAVALDKNLALAHYHIGIAEEKLGRIEEAVRTWDEAIRSDPEGQTGRLARESKDAALRGESPAGGAR